MLTGVSGALALPETNVRHGLDPVAAESAARVATIQSVSQALLGVEREAPVALGPRLPLGALAQSVAWSLSWPVRFYWAHSSRQLGKKLVVDRVLKRALRDSTFEATLAGGGKVVLSPREDIGLITLLHGTFEPAETECARRYARTGTMAIDVGANIGMFTIPLARAVGESGRVLAIEPAAENVERLESNLLLNMLCNVEVKPMAAAEKVGQLLLKLGADPAFHSTTAIVRGREGDGSVTVPADTLDNLWAAAGTPPVSFLKIDTEGGEISVLRGAEKLLRTERPAILVEAKGRRVRELDELLVPLSYRRSRPAGFAVGNHLYTRVRPST
jgi:FkbM family methyltransferase